MQKMGSVRNGHFTQDLAAISTPTMLESSVSLTGSSSATGGLCQREWWTSALGGRNTVIFSSWTLPVPCLKILPELWFCRPNIPWLASALWGHHVTLAQPGRWESEGDGWQTALSGKELTTYADPHFCFSLNFIKC